MLGSPPFPANSLEWVAGKEHLSGVGTRGTSAKRGNCTNERESQLIFSGKESLSALGLFLLCSVSGLK